MSATKQDIKDWLIQGKAEGATHVIVALDTFDYENYPVYVFAHENIAECVGIIKAESMQIVDEVYNLSMDIEEQLSAHHVWNI
jgi:hypothetical protein